MWMIKGALYLLVLIAMAFFFAQNSGKSVDLRFFNREYLDIPLYYIMVGSFLVGLVFSLLVGTFFGVHPARRAAKLHPVDALR